MNKHEFPIVKLTVVLAIGIAIGAVVTSFIPSSTETVQQSSEPQPLYWVAPMDANYRRDKPGKSPMGMDLVPVYPDGGASQGAGPGTVSISPDVINNLGVRTGGVERRTLQDEITTVGYVQFDENKLVHIHPRTSGWVEKLYVKAEGDPIKKGQPLYALYSPELVNAQEELVLALNRNSPRLIKASKERLKALQFSTSNVKTLKRTKRVQQTVTFFAPQDGVVDNLSIREGFYVKPGTTMLSIGAMDQVWVEAEVFERQAALIKLNDPVTMTLDYLPGRQWEGKIDYIYPTLDKKNRTARIRLKFNNADGLLKPNMFAQVVIHSDSEDSLLTIPREALIRTGQQDRVVLSLGEGRYKSIAVSIGRMDQNFVEVTKGLDEGESVVVSAQFLLDSESSKSSDFKRMHHGDEAPASVWVAGEIQSVMSGHHMVTATHDAIDVWGWPAMKMDFMVSDTVDFDALKVGTQLHMEVTKGEDKKPSITGIHIMNAPMLKPAQQAKTTGIVNSIDFDSRTANISRQAIEKWNRPAATLDFSIDQAIDASKMRSGEEISFTFEVRGGDFVVTEFERSQP